MFKGQASLEYFMLLAVVLVVLLPFSFIAFSEMDAKNTIAMAKLAATKIRHAADNVYAQGEDSKATITIYLPSKISNFSITQKEIIVEATSIGGQKTQISDSVRGTMLPTGLATTEGIRPITATYNSTTNLISIKEE